MNGGDLAPFCLTLDSFHADYLPTASRSPYSADVSYTVGRGDGPAKADTLSVNHPLRLDGANVYLLGHGYAPVLRYTDRYGHSITETAPFLPQDSNFTSTGAVAFPDANVDPTTHSNVDPKTFVKQQVGLQGFYLPDGTAGRRERRVGLGLSGRAQPAARPGGLPGRPRAGRRRPAVGLLARPVADRLGRAQGRRRQRPAAAAPGRDGDAGRRFERRVRRHAAVRDAGLRYDPGEKLVLAGAVALVIGLLVSLTGRRRRIWFRVLPGPTGDGRRLSVASAGGLARTEYASFADEFDGIVDAARSSQDGQEGVRSG